MTLKYQREINGKQTHFPEKIIRSLHISEPKKMTHYDLLCEVIPENEQLNIHEFQELNPKLHTIRKDDKERWEVGTPIHSKIWEGKPYHSPQYQFIPIVPVKAIQKIEIIEMIMTQTDYCYQKKDSTIFKVQIDGITLSENEIRQLAINDGFDDSEAFFDYFKDGFKGVIIHWTDLKY